MPGLQLTDCIYIYKYNSMFDQSHKVKLPIYFIGLTKAAGGNIVCVTENYLVYEIEVAINNSKGIFHGPQVRKLKMSTNSNMLCSDIATIWGRDKLTIRRLLRSKGIG